MGQNNSDSCGESAEEQRASEFEDNSESESRVFLGRIGFLFQKRFGNGESSISSDSYGKSVEEQIGSELENNDEGSIIIISDRFVECVEDQNGSELEDNSEGSIISNSCGESVIEQKRFELEDNSESPSRSDLFGQSEHHEDSRCSRKRVFLRRISFLFLIFFATLLCWTIVVFFRDGLVTVLIFYYFYQTLLPIWFLDNGRSPTSTCTVYICSFVNAIWSIGYIYLCSFFIHETNDAIPSLQIAISSIALFSALYHPIVWPKNKKMEEVEEEEEDPFEFNEVPVEQV
mmetsp:Transcript_673/g.1390  ORF Transcript_673/g.1390 Transcript_673/m.1390 type:complete len:288 (-) Transcript_673:390-1253(-)